MLIGVDESGSFKEGTRALFVGVLIRPSERDDLLLAHRTWEKAVRKNLGLANELKGYSVTDYWGQRYFKEVLARDGCRRVGYLAVAVDVDNASLSAMEVQRQIFSEQYARWADDCRSKEQHERVKWIEQHAEWVRVRSPVQILKLVMLGTFVANLLEMAMPEAILGGFDEELEHLKVMIDRGYVKQDDLPRWREVLRNAFINESHLRPITILDTWPDDHPFLQKFVDRGGNGPTLLKPAFRDMIEFYDSAATPEVRIADVVASLVYRATIIGEQLPCYSSIRTLSLEPQHPYTLFAWTTNRRPPMANPYEAFGTGND